MGKYQQDAVQLLELVGGKENIAVVSHCVTRMRFVLNDPKKADVPGIETMKVSKETITQAGQFQVIIGNTVFHTLPVGICWSVTKKMGTKLIGFDPARIKAAGHPCITVLVVTEEAEQPVQFRTGMDVSRTEYHSNDWSSFLFQKRLLLQYRSSMNPIKDKSKTFCQK